MKWQPFWMDMRWWRGNAVHAHYWPCNQPTWSCVDAPSAFILPAMIWAPSIYCRGRFKDVRWLMVKSVQTYLSPMTAIIYVHRMRNMKYLPSTFSFSFFFNNKYLLMNWSKIILPALLLSHQLYICVYVCGRVYILYILPVFFF